MNRCLADLFSGVDFGLPIISVTLYYLDCILRALTKAGSGHRKGYPPVHGLPLIIFIALSTRRDTEAAAVTFVLIYLYNFSDHLILSFLNSALIKKSQR
jgi:hypothetical protein